MGVRPSQENWKLAQLFSLTSHSRIKDKPKKVITVVRSLNCSTKTLVAFCSFIFSVLFFSFHFCSFLCFSFLFFSFLCFSFLLFSFLFFSFLFFSFIFFSFLFFSFHASQSSHHHQQVHRKRSSRTKLGMDALSILQGSNHSKNACMQQVSYTE